MDNSVSQARWILAPIFGLCIAFLSVSDSSWADNEWEPVKNERT